MNSYLDQLNPSQKEAVIHNEGPMMIIAGAGSGKTRVLTYRVAHLMEQGVDPFQILMLTFTNKAAREMKSRIAEVVGESEAKNLWMGTFHSVFARLLRADADKLGYPSNFTIYDTSDSVRLLTSVIKEMNLNKDAYKPKQILGRISNCKNNLITVKAYFNNPEHAEADKLANRPEFGNIYKNYVDRCFKAGVMDFDDLLLRTNELLNLFPEVLAKYQDRFRYVMVDEYQDTNHSQYFIVKALADRYQNICVVGDDAQSIYAFRGANIQNILNFQKHYQDVKIFKLEQNYRSTQNIVNAANSLISKNKTKLDKEVWTENGTGGKIKVMRTVTEGEEGVWVANTIFDAKMNQQLSNNDFCVLYRTNAQSRAIEEALRKKRIAYKIFGGTSFYQRKEIKDVLSYLRLLVNPQDEEAFKRVVNYPARGIGQTTLDRLVIAANENQTSLFEVASEPDAYQLKVNASTKQKLIDFTNTLRRFQIAMDSQDAFELTSDLIKQIRIIKDLESDGTPEGISRVENVQELLNGIQFFIEQQKEKEEDTSLVAFLEDVSLKSDLDDAKPDEPVVSLMTIHLAKGLEYPHVFIVGMEENLFPSGMSLNTRAELEEERRLFYVALTRAEQQVYLTFTKMRRRWGKTVDNEPSRFLEEIEDSFKEKLYADIPVRPTRPVLDANIFGSDIPKSQIRFRKPISAQKNNPQKSNVLKGSVSQLPQRFKKVSDHTGGDQNNKVSNQFKVGAQVKHGRFGKGKITELSGLGGDQKATVYFELHGEKKMILKFAKLQLI